MTNHDAFELVDRVANEYPGGITQGRLLEAACEEAGVEWLSVEWGFLAAIVSDYINSDQIRNIGRSTSSGDQAVYVRRARKGGR